MRYILILTVAIAGLVDAAIGVSAELPQLTDICADKGAIAGDCRQMQELTKASIQSMNATPALIELCGAEAKYRQQGYGVMSDCIAREQRQARFKKITAAILGDGRVADADLNSSCDAGRKTAEYETCLATEKHAIDVLRDRTALRYDDATVERCGARARAVDGSFAEFYKCAELAAASTTR